MLRWSLRASRFFAGVILLSSPLFAARPADTLLPNNTKGFLSIASVDQLSESWEQTQLGQLLQDPIMKPFADDLKRQLQEKWLRSHQHLGLTWADFQGVPAGEVAVALVQPAKNEAATVLIVDIHGHEAAANALVEKIGHKLAELKAKKSLRQAHGATITVFDIPKTDERPAAVGAYFIKDGELVIGDHIKVLEGVLGRLVASSGAENLASASAYSHVMQRCQTSAGELEPHLRWFVEPFGYTEAVRVAHPPKNRRKGLDLVKILRNQGFSAVQGIGGFLNFAPERYEMLHRTAVYAPAVAKAGDERYELAARMLDFPSRGKLEPQSWVPREITSYASFHWNVQKAFESVGTLVNEIVGDSVWEDILESMKTDPNGPQIDLRNDLVAHLGQRATVLSDYKLPITPKSERLLIAIESRNDDQIAATVAKAMQADQNARRRDMNGLVIWEITSEDAPTGPAIQLDEGADAECEEEQVKLPNSAVTVAHGHLLIATHIDFLIKVLNNDSTGETLANSTDYQAVHAELQKLTSAENSIQAFSRTDDEYRAVYELIRTDKMPEAETMLGRLLNIALGEGKEGVLRHQQIDGRKMPDYEQIKRYFGPAGLSVHSEDDGWFITGFSLSKQLDHAITASAKK